MSVRRIAGYMLFLLFAYVTCSAFLYTLTRVRTTLPWSVLRFGYAMMAPYQGYATKATAFVAEGRREGEGEWETIDLAPYFPVSRGETIARALLRSFVEEDGNDARRREQYVIMALQLLEREQERGNAFAEVRLLFEQWPVSVLGYEANRIEPLIERYPLARVSR